MAETAMAPRLMSSTHDPEAAVAGRIRRRVRALLETWGIGDASADDVLLVVEELVANVLDHARTRFEIAVRLSGSVVHIAVRDHSARSPRIRPVDPLAARGRGLQLVAGLSERWGCERHADGKTVWAELSVGGC